MTVDKQNTMTQRFTIPGRLAGMNEYQRACRSHWSNGYKMKLSQEARVSAAIAKSRLSPFPGAVHVSVLWVEKDRRRDLDNITAAMKWVLDALVRTGVIRGDGERWVKGIDHNRAVDKHNPRVEVEITDAEVGGL